MLIFIVINFKKLISSGKNYPWEKPDHCPNCGSAKLWGHGYVRRYFDGYNNAVWIKRYQCPLCKSVHTCRPVSHYARIQSSRSIVITVLSLKIIFNKFLNGLSRQRQQYWYRRFCVKSSRFKNNEHKTDDLLEMIQKGLNPVADFSEYFENDTDSHAPYLSFALSANTGFT